MGQLILMYPTQAITMHSVRTKRPKRTNFLVVLQEIRKNIRKHFYALQKVNAAYNLVPNPSASSNIF